MMFHFVCSILGQTDRIHSPLRCNPHANSKLLSDRISELTLTNQTNTDQCKTSGTGTYWHPFIHSNRVLWLLYYLIGSQMRPGFNWCRCTPRNGASPSISNHTDLAHKSGSDLLHGHMAVPLKSMINVTQARSLQGMVWQSCSQEGALSGPVTSFHRNVTGFSNMHGNWTAIGYLVGV